MSLFISVWSDTYSYTESLRIPPCLLVIQFQAIESMVNQLNFHTLNLPQIIATIITQLPQKTVQDKPCYTNPLFHAPLGPAPPSPGAAALRWRRAASVSARCHWCNRPRRRDKRWPWRSWENSQGLKWEDNNWSIVGSDDIMMEIWWKYDGNMMEIWWKYDGYNGNWRGFREIIMGILDCVREKSPGNPCF